MLPKRLKQLRNEKDITQDKLGEILGLSQQTIGHYEKNRAHPDHETLGKMANYFNVSTDYLLGRTNNRKEVLPEPTDQELEEILRNSNIKFHGEALDDEDKDDIINFLRMVRRKKQK